MSTPPVLDFGRHKGTRITRVPISYLRWMVNESHSWADQAKAELDRRGVGELPSLELSTHAIDRASLRVRRQWHQDRGSQEGLYTWLLRIAGEALEAGPVEGDCYEVRGVRLVIAQGQEWPVVTTVMPCRTRADEEGGE